MNVRKNALSRVTALILALAMVVSIIPVNPMSVVKAEEAEPVKVAAGEKEVYLYGVEKAEDAIEDAEGNYEIVVEGTTETESTLYVGGEEVTVSEENPEVQYQDSKVILDKEWLDAQLYWVAVSFGEEIPALEGVSVKVNELTYDKGNAQKAVTVECEREAEGATILYSNDGITFTKDPVEVTDAGESSAFVKVIKEGYAAYISEELKVVVSPAKLKRDITFTVCNKEYDGTAEKAFSVAGYDESLDTVSYSTDGGNTFTVIEKTSDGDNIPTLTEPGELDVIIKITRDNYEDWVSKKKTAVISEAEDTNENIEITPYSGTYDGEAHEIVTEISGNLEGYTIWYKENKRNASYSITEPTVVNAGSYSYKVGLQKMFHKMKEYEVEVNIQKRPQQIEFDETIIPETITYKEDNSFTTYVATKVVDSPQSETAITYSLGEECPDVTTIDSATGEVTYFNAGTIEVIAKVDEPNNGNYEDAEDKYEVEVVHVDVPEYTISSPVNYKGYKTANPYKITPEKGWTIIAGSNAIGQEDWKDSLEIKDEGKYSDYKVAFKNENGEITDLVTLDEFVIDNTDPEVKSFEFEELYSDMGSKLFNKLSFGFFCQEAMKITVNATDGVDDAATGIKEIKLAKYNKDNEFVEYVPANEGEEFEDGVAIFTIGVGFDGFLKAEVIDNVENTSGLIVPSESNSNILGDPDDKDKYSGNGYVMVEDTDPVIVPEEKATENGIRVSNYVNPREVTNKNKSHIELPVIDESGNESTIDVYSSDIQFDFYASDADSGLATVVASLTNVNEELKQETETVVDATCKTKGKDNEVHEHTVTTEGKVADKDGKYIFKVDATDNAGNVLTLKKEVYKDTTYPIIKDFSIELLEPEKDEEGIEEEVVVTDYGFYFKKAVNVTVTAEDVASANECNTGVESITYILVDSSGKVIKEETFKAEEGKITFDVGGDEDNDGVADGFKGQIYAYATDKVGNKPSNSTQLVDHDKIVVEEAKLGVKKVGDELCVHPKGTIIETEQKHSVTSSIEFTVPETDYVQSKATTTAYKYNGDAMKDGTMHKNAAEVPLYAEALIIKKEQTIKDEQTIGIKVTDTFSGIEKVTWKVVNGEESEEIEVPDEVTEESIKALEEKGWTVTREEGSNLITGLSREIEVTDNQNNLVLLVELTDNAGNVSYDYYVFGIDTTKPAIEVTYNNNDGDTLSGDGTYFDADRTATIVISERNFNADNVVVKVTKDKKETPVTLNWKKTSGTGNLDNTKYTATIPYSKDGDYTFAISCKDEAAHANDGVNYGKSVAPTKFTVDKTKPTISVSYNNNSAQNGKYFKANRTATITVTEHNFDVDRVTLTQTARKDGASITVPRASWSSNGDVHTATIAYNADGDYTFDITMEDKAGNKSDEANYGSSVAGKDFTVDTTIVEPTISGVKNGNAYKDEVIPEISFSDINFNEVEVKLLRTRNGEKNVDVTKEFIKSIAKNAKGGSGTYDTFEEIQENDGIYTLTVKMTDKAGNTSTKTVKFTVNRYGSVYEFGSYLTELQDSYVQKVDKDIVITEYNASKLVADSLQIQITRDGVPVSNPVYTVSPAINNSAKVGEGGWYQYTYTIDPSNFAEDGVYRITIASKDAAGNMPETENYEDLEMLFRVDTTPAEITSVVGLEKAIVNADSLEFKMEVFDAIGLKSIKVYVNDKEVEVFDSLEDLINFMGSYKLSSGSNQKIKIVVEDLAGNITDTSAEGFDPEYEFNDEVTVSTNFFIRWFANKPVFIGSIVGIVAVAAGLFWFLVVKRKKDEDK